VNLRRTVFALAFACAVCAAHAAWLYPQMDFEIMRVREMQDDVRRMSLYAAHPGELPAMSATAQFRIKCPKDARTPFFCDRLAETRYDEAEGRLYVLAFGGYAGGGAIRSPRTDWEARTFDGSWRPVAAYPDGPLPPHRVRPPEVRVVPVATNGWWDLGRESLAYVECACRDSPVLRAGESIPEMLDDDTTLMEYSPEMVQVGEGRWRSAHALAMRYFRLKGSVSDVKVSHVVYPRPAAATFSSPHARWNRMREAGVRTLELCADDFLIDGIKRDRLPWGGDLTVSMLADAYVWGDASVARASLSAMDAYVGDVNGTASYSMWTLVSHDFYQLYFGDAQFLKDRWWRIRWRVENLISRTDPETGFVVKGLDWVFIDWAKPESRTALHALWYGALQASARLADRVKDARAKDYRALAEKVKASLDRLAWDEVRGLYRANLDGTAEFGRQANVLAVVFGAADAKRSARIAGSLAKDDLPPVGTPYMFGWELVVLARTGHVKEFHAGLERVFGAMLDAGATTFWEGYDASEKGDERYRFYGRKWGKSLCHVWSAWPAFIFVSEVMGVKPTADGWATWEEKPLPGAEGCRATVNTPHGMLRFPLQKQ